MFSNNFFSNKKTVGLFIVVALIFLYACNPTKHLNPEEKLLKKSNIKIDNRKVDTEELEGVIKQKPNKKILGLFRFHLGVYNLYKKESKSKIKANIGEPPVVYDSLLTKKTQKQLTSYLHNKGYFRNKVSYTEKTKDQKTSINYSIKTGEAYTIEDVNLRINDPVIKKLFVSNFSNSKIRLGKNYDVDLLDDERERIKNFLKDEGYYKFRNDFVNFEVDTTKISKKVHLTIIINDNKVKQYDNTYKTVPHVKYYINKITVFIGKNFKNETFENYDTLEYENINIAYHKELKFKPKMIKHAISFKPYELYLLRDHKSTYKRLAELRIFKYINFEFEDYKEDMLNCNIYLSPQPLKSATFETELNSSGGDVGLLGSIIYENKNTFKGGERFTTKLRGGVEVQQLLNSENNNHEIIDNLPFNTLEFGPEFNLEFPRFLLPISLDKFSRRANPKTTVHASYNFQQRPDFKRDIFEMSYGYYWNESQFKRHTIIPLDLSLIKFFPSTEFEEQLNKTNDPFILKSYSDHFITATKYTYTFNNQEINKIKDFVFFRANVEFAGNILSAFHKMINTPKDSAHNNFEIIDIRYAQYIKNDFDFRHYNQYPNTSFVKRFAIGIGVPYGNLDVLPFEKSFYAGGSNGIRAWRARSLGPGSIHDTIAFSTVDHIGELKIETNIEYRFDITKIVEGAVFADAGNIWMLEKDINRPNAEININRIWDDIAIGTGIGIRLDFSFFIIRFDFATPIKDPGTLQPKEFKLYFKQTTLNLGIGYPF